MKKSFTLIGALLFGFGSFAQSQRMVLAEEFTQASCGPCAAQNPAYNALLRNNQDKVISLKYQTSWPGSDPMNAQNPDDVQKRVDYYNVTGVPDVYVDGNMQSSVAPGNITQTIINNEFAVTAPYDVIVNHSLNAAQDSIFITVTLNCTQAVSGALVAHVAIAENFIKFASAPGSNGEKDFQYNIMRKMLPNKFGTQIATSWTNGQTQTLTFSEKIPTYIYDKNQLAVVAFVQDTLTKNVKQAAYSAMLNNDASIAQVTNANPAPGCSVNFTPTVKIINKGKATLTSAIITPLIDGVAGTPLNWTGLLSIFASDVVTMPTVTTTAAGSHTYAVNVTMPNGSVDVATQEDSYSSKFYLFSNAQPYPYTQDFASSGFPYANWIVENADADVTWTRVSAGSVANGGSAKIDFYNSAPGRIDNLYLPSIDLTNATSSESATLDFKVAGAPYTAATPENDMLIVEVSSDCGATWTELWNKSGATLYTAAATTSSFSPSAAQFRDESVSLNAYKGQSKVIIRYSGVSDYGNNVFVDKINLFVANTSSVKKVSALSSIDIFPNPANTAANLHLNLDKTEQIKIEVYNMLGENVYSLNQNTLAAGEHYIKIDTQNLTNGVYMINVISSEGTITKKFVVSK